MLKKAPGSGTTYSTFAEWRRAMHVTQYITGRPWKLSAPRRHAGETAMRMRDVVGPDAATPQLISDFAR